MTENIDLDALPGLAVLTKKQVAKITGLGLVTLWKLHAAGDGPELIRLSPGRVGIRVDALRKWLDQRDKA